ncbi:unnamed protein product [Adineta steineri]|uniref:Uncharacterized protein n=1 Tax=Adineta steineri TaxID=433720 RepID=A0A815YMM8_9BILA|nr:unnamed protein product [Adineta steineri]CAF1297181.1 unnamed protein product [Adineta steineri]CAF1329328.1 unnamed protein product [Adineta steineri]CAF1539269.1 unnamed protein product [Adineta steineri]CAF1573789.1 unnamed protein product [Adineta steineri]
MADSARRPLPAPRPYGVRSAVARPVYGARPAIRPAASGAGLGGALGAIGGTLGCLLCLAAIGALGLFACLIAITAYAKQFLDAYKRVEGISGAYGQAQVGLVLLFASLFYTIVCRMQRC